MGAATAPTALAPAAAERRQLTVMFCDLVDSMSLSTGLDLEDLKAALDAYQQSAGGVVAEYGGYIAQYLGDGLLAYFGYPKAQEDDPARALHAAIGIVQAVHTLNGAQQHHLAVRIGIHTGLVVVGTLGHPLRQERLALGEAPNVAARLQSLAAPNGIVVSELTARLAGPEFTFKDRGSHGVKGLAHALRIFEVGGKEIHPSRFDARHQGSLSPMVARDEELGRLLNWWEGVRHGHGRVVSISGEAGIGKSRLLAASWETIREDGALAIRFQCSPHHRHSAFHPYTENFIHVLDLRSAEPDAIKLDRLDALLLDHYGLPATDVGLIATLLALPAERYPDPALTPLRRRQETTRVLVDIVVAAAKIAPVVIYFEDVHWIDPTSLEVIGRVIDRIDRLPVLGVITHRPDFLPPWQGQPHIESLVLRRLSPDETSSMVDMVAGSARLSEATRRSIADRTDGVPLFIEELTRTVVTLSAEADAIDGQPELQVPASLRDSLMARLDRDPQSKVLAQIGAAIGREFNYESLQALAAQPVEALVRCLESLVRADVLSQRGSPPTAVYSFKHALLQDVAYDSLPRARRMTIHAGVARFIENQSGNLKDTQPELLAHHLAAAGELEAAIMCRIKASKLAASRSAYQEALSHLDIAESLLASIDTGTTRLGLELRIELQRSAVLFVQKGMWHADTGASFERARALCSRSGDDVEETISALFGIYVFYLVSGNAPRSVSAAEEAMRRARKLGSAPAIMLAHRALGPSLIQRGHLDAGCAQLRSALDLYDPQRDAGSGLLYGTDLKAASLAWLAYGLVQLGALDRAVAVAHEAIHCAESLHNHHGTALALSWLSFVHRQRGEPEPAIEAARRGIALSDKHQLNWLHYAKTDLGVALIDNGDHVNGEALLQEFMVWADSAGHSFNRPYLIAAQAGLNAKAGDWERALLDLERARQFGIRNGEAWFTAELHRLRGEYLRLGGHHEEAASNFETARRLASAENARLWELRATASLASLHIELGRTTEVGALLAPVVAGFTEGLASPHLREARQILALGAA